MQDLYSTTIAVQLKLFSYLTIVSFTTEHIDFLLGFRLLWTHDRTSTPTDQSIAPMVIAGHCEDLGR